MKISTLFLIAFSKIMDQRPIITAGSVLLLLALSVFAEEERKTNVILIMSDDTGYEVFGCYGSRQYKTPHIDKLAQTGMRFNHCYSQPLCTPSRVKIMTGISNAHNYQCFDYLDKNERTFGHMMKDAGYATCIAGKWQLYGLEKHEIKGTLPEDAGFDEHCLWQVATKRSRYWKPTLRINGERKTFLGEDDFGPNICTDFICDFIGRNKDGPFFVYYPMMLTHGPIITTPESADRSLESKQENFEDMVAYMDTLVGRIAAKLDEAGIRDNTLILFTGDNGTTPGIKSELNGSVLPGGKGKTTDFGTRVALIANMPGTVPAGKVTDDLVDFSDMMPTIAGMTGAELPEGVKLDGVSFAPQLRGQEGTPRQWIYCYHEARPGPVPSPKIFARNHRWKLYNNGQLFDVGRDVLEKIPVPGNNEIRKELQKVIDSFPNEGKMIRRPEDNAGTSATKKGEKIRLKREKKK